MQLLYRYFVDYHDPFCNYTESDLIAFDTLDDDYIALEATGKKPPYDRAYFRQRFATEELIRNRFIELGGEPQLHHPYYMTLGNFDEWFYDVKHCSGSLAIPVTNFDGASLSFTFGDSIPNCFPNLERKAKPYCGNVFTLEDLPLLCDMAKECNSSHTTVAYIEAQVWKKEPISNYRPAKHLLSLEKAIAQSTLVANSVMLANEGRLSATKDRHESVSLSSIMRSAKESRCFVRYLKMMDPNQYLSSPVHGFAHCLRTAIYGNAIAQREKLNELQTGALILSCFMHDVARISEGRDKMHGERSSQVITTMVNSVSEVEKELAIVAVRAHCVGDEVLKDLVSQYPSETFREDAVVVANLLKVCDSLDYIRFGIKGYSPKAVHQAELSEYVNPAIALNVLSLWYPEVFSSFASSIG